MSNLEKAKISELKSGGRVPIEGTEVEVQFNPESLSIQLTNRVEGGKSAGRQVRQFVGSSSSVFSLDLEFDTADEGTTLNPVSVLERTAILEKFLKPKKQKGKKRGKPAKIRFHWGNLIIDGIVESIDLEFDHFAQNGVPLHAKAGLKIKQQKIEFQYNSDAVEPDNQEQDVITNQGDTHSDVSNDLGKDPADWRDLNSKPISGMELEPGTVVNYKPKKSSSLGSGLKPGLNSGINNDLAINLGLSVGANVTIAKHLTNDPRPKKQVSSGLALTQAGGVDAATKQLATGNSQRAVGSALDAFSASASSQSVKSSNASINTRPSARIQSDARATGFGFGVPLQSKRVPLLNQQQSLRASSKGRMAILERNWCLSNSGRKVADQVQTKRRPQKRCGCQSHCKH